MPDRYIVDGDDKQRRARVRDGRLQVQSSLAAPPSGSFPFFRYLDTVGDGSGTKNANGDYSSELVEFYVESQEEDDAALIVSRMIVTIRDQGNFSTAGYGAAAALTNGFTIQVRDSDETVLLDLTDGLVIQTNGDWSRECYDVQPIALGGGDSYMSVRWTFAKSGRAIRLNKGHRLAVRLNDSFTFLTGQFFNVQGYIG